MPMSTRHITLTFLLLATISIRLLSGAEPAVHYYNYSSGTVGSNVANELLERIAWPSAKYQESNGADRMDIEYWRPRFELWARVILRTEWLPPDGKWEVFGIKDWGLHSEDVLFMKYAIGARTISIFDRSSTMTVVVSNSGVDIGVTNWVQIRGVFAKFLKDFDKATNYTTVHVGRWDTSGIERINVSAPPPVTYPVEAKEPWGGQNPTVWVHGQMLVFEVQKLHAGVVANDEEYGVRRRFPPLKGVLDKAKLSDIERYLSEERGPTEEDLAVQALVKKSETSEAVSAIMRIYSSAKSAHLKLGIIYNIVPLTATTGQERLQELYAFLQDARDKETDDEVKSALENALRRTK